MIAFTFIFSSILLATMIPAYVALYLVNALRFVQIRYLAAAGVGLSFWYFFDTMGDATSLGVNNSVYPPGLFGGLPHFALIGAFLAGIAVLAIFDHYAVPAASKAAPGQSSGVRGSLFLVPMAVALVMGIHGLGEGWDAVSAVSSGPAAGAPGLDTLIQAFGSLPAVASYPIHKFLEASIIAVLYSAYVSRTGGAVESRWWEIPLMGLAFAGPSGVGAAVGYFVSFDTSYFFAFGVTAVLYAALRLAEPVSPSFNVGVNGPSPFGPKAFFAMTVGFFLLYTAALLH